MCNLSQGIKEIGVKEGRLKERFERDNYLIATMNEQGYTLEQIADLFGKSVPEVQRILTQGQ